MNRQQIGLRVQQGFTLIELVIVLVLLGILVAVAVPKYTDLSTDAKSASAGGQVGAIRSAAAIAAAVAGGTPTVAQVIAQGSGFALGTGSTFDVNLPNGDSVVVAFTADADADCPGPAVGSPTNASYVCSVDSGTYTAAP